MHHLDVSLSAISFPGNGQTCVFISRPVSLNPAPLSHSRDSLCFPQMLHGTVSCFTSLLSSFLPSFWLDLLQVSRHSCVFELLASFPLGYCCIPPANPSSQQAASASKVAGMPRPPFILIESRPLFMEPRPALQHIYIYIYIYTETTLMLDYLPCFLLGN